MAEESNSSKKKISPVTIVLVVIIIALVGGGVYAYQQLSTQMTENQGIKTEPNVVLNDEDAEEFLKDKIGSIRISMNQRIACERNSEGKLIGKIGVENKNDFQYMFRVYLADTGEALYESGLIPPDGKVDEIPIEKDLEVGKHSVNVLFDAISTEDNQTSLGSTGINTDLLVYS